jgi:copper chaperone CopZ
MHTTTATLCQRFTVIGMTCGHCEAAIAAEVAAGPGVVSATADAATGTLIVECSTDPGITALAAAVDEAGYELSAR